MVVMMLQQTDGLVMAECEICHKNFMLYFKQIQFFTKIFLLSFYLRLS